MATMKAIPDRWGDDEMALATMKAVSDHWDDDEDNNNGDGDDE